MTTRPPTPAATGTQVAPATGEEGTSTVELALVFPIFFLLFWGMIVYGMVFQTSHTIDAAASEAARAAISARDAAEATTIATTTADSLLSALGSKAGSATVAVSPPAACATVPGANCLTVTITYPWGTDPVVPDGPLGGTMTPNVLTASSTIQLSE